jgi:GxxExxY protein
LEHAYQACLAYELRKRNLKVVEQVPIPIYDEVFMGIGYRADMLVEDAVIVELKTVESICDKHESQPRPSYRVG